MFRVLSEIEKQRIRVGSLASDESYGCNGAFDINVPGFGYVFVVISDGLGWEHVSVSRKDDCPTWEVMKYIKGLFWDDTDLVVQFHPPSNDYVDNHSYCLHLWRKSKTNDYCEIPPKGLV